MADFSPGGYRKRPTKCYPAPALNRLAVAWESLASPRKLNDQQRIRPH